MMLRRKRYKLLCQLHILVLFLALLLLLVMVAVLDPEAQSEGNSRYLHQYHDDERRWAGVGSMQEKPEESDQYKVEILSPLSSLRDEELIAIGISGRRRTLDRVRRNMYRIVKQSKRKNEGDTITNNGYTEKEFSTHGFNETASQTIPLHRAIPEGRNALCLQETYNENLPTASVIISFHNEAWSTLLRTVHSVVDNSPKMVLKEVILVDDLSHQGHLKSALSEYVSRIGRVKLIRSNKRLGVIGGRMLGAARATGEVLVFMDPHCECHPGWLEPLLNRIMRSRNRIVSPVLDVIDWRTFDYYHSAELKKGVLEWNLDLQWVNVPDSEENVRQSPIMPFRTPVIPGCVIAVDRHYFQNIGAFDTGMNFPGVENIELSIRVWLCGGIVEIVPCSRVGHVAQNHTIHDTPTKEAMLRNKLRIVMVWMDSYKDIFYSNIGKELVNYTMKTIDVKDREQLRLRLGCKGFQWFIDNIQPDINNSFSTIETSGQLFNSGAGLCVQYTFNTGIPHLDLSTCADHVNQIFVYYNKKIRLKSTEALCLDVTDEQIIFKNCTLNDLSTWEFIEAGLVIHIPTGKCMQLAGTDTSEPFLFVRPCNNKQRSQVWKMIPT